MPDFDALLRAPAHARRELPTTSQPSIGDFLAVYEPLLDGGQRHRLDPPLRRDLRHLRLRAAGQGAARGAGPRGRIEVVDSATRVRRPGPASCSPRPRRPRGGRRRSTRSSRTRETAREQLKIWFAVDTLEYLRRGGRIGAAQAWLGGALKIKPILTLEEEITPDRARAHRRAGRSSGWSTTCASRASRRRRRVGRPAHPGARRRPSGWSSAGARSSAPSPLFVSEVGPVIGAHVGPGPARRRRACRALLR